MPFAYLTQKNNQMCLQNNKDNYPARNVRFHLIERNQQFITTDCDPQSQIILARSEPNYIPGKTKHDHVLLHNYTITSATKS